MKCILTWQQSSTSSYMKCNFKGLSPRWSSSLRRQGKAASAESGVRSDSFSEQENIRGSWGGSGSCGTLLAHSSCSCHFAAATDKGFGPHLCPSLQNRDTSPELWQVLSLKEKLWCGFRHHWSKPQDQQRKDDALIRCSFYICQELDEQGKECASSPLELQVTGSVPALAWPPAPVTCLSSTASANPGGSMKATGRQLLSICRERNQLPTFILYK